MEVAGGQRLQERPRAAQHPDQESAAAALQRSDGLHWKTTGRAGRMWWLSVLLKEQHAEDTVTFSILPLFTLAEVNICVFQVSLPNRSCQVHQLKLSQDEQAVYDVVFAQSR